jgi:hypothetical protein
MPFYETLYETGRMSVACYEDDAEAQSALKNHNDRAKSGESGGPVGQPAERIAAVYIYDKHPNEYNPDQTMSADVAQKEVAALVKAMSDDNGVVNVDRIALAVRDISHPMVVGSTKTEPFASTYKMKEKGKLDLAFLEA